MHKLSLRASVAVLAVASVCSLASAQLSVDAGYDLFQSTSNSSFLGVDFVGLPAEVYTFPNPIGKQNVDTTDTIIQRLNTVTAAAPGDTVTTPIQVDLLQLVSTAPTNAFGPMTTYYYITLNPNAPSLGTMSITVNNASGGMFTSMLDINFEIHMGSLNGPVTYTGDIPLTNTGDTWGRTPIAGAVTIPGVNLNLDGTDNAADFWPGVPLTESHPGAGEHVVTDGATPEPSQWAVFAVPGCLMLLRRRRASR